MRPKDPGALAGALGDLLADPERRARYGAAGRTRYRTHFTSRRMADQTAAVYTSLLARRVGR